MKRKAHHRRTGLRRNIIIMKNIRSTVPGAQSKLHCKDSEDNQQKQIILPIFKDVANIEAVKTEIGDVIKIFNYEMREAYIEVMAKKAADPLKYQMRGFYSQDLNATIKSRILKRMNEDSLFNNKIRVKSNSGSIYFVIKDKYILYVKRLYGNQNMPNSFPTPQRDMLFNGSLFKGELKHIPILFIGPNLGNIKSIDAYVTSLISKKELNWTLSSTSLYQETDIVTLKPTPVENTEKEIARVKPSLATKAKKSNNQ